MKKVNRKIMLAAGLVMMCVILVLFGFTETQIPKPVWLGMWTLCAGAVSRGAGVSLTV